MTRLAKCPESKASSPTAREDHASAAGCPDRRTLRGLSYEEGAAALSVAPLTGREVDQLLASYSGSSEMAVLGFSEAMLQAAASLQADARLSRIRDAAMRDMGRVKERRQPGRRVFKSISDRGAKTWIRAFQRKKLAAKLQKYPRLLKAYKGATSPDAKRSITKRVMKRTWFKWAADAKSLKALRSYAKAVGLSYDEHFALQAGSYEWCGSLIGAFYKREMRDGAPVQGASASPTQSGRRAPKTYPASRAYLGSLASTRKSYNSHNYKGGWKKVWIVDPHVTDPHARVAEKYKPMRAYHAQYGGERQWFRDPERWSDPTAFVKPGMTLYVNGPKRRGSHMVIVNEVKPHPEGGWFITSLEGNKAGPGMTRVAGRGGYRLGGKKKTSIRGAAGPARADFDTRLRYIRRGTHRRLLRAERRADRRAKKDGKG